MRRVVALAVAAAGLACALSLCVPAGFASARGDDPYEVCREHGPGADFNRCISEVYIEEVRRAGTVTELEEALRGRGNAGGFVTHDIPCLFNPATGRYQECFLISSGEQCLQYAGPCVP